MSHVTCLDMSRCFVGSRMSHINHIHFRVHVLGLHSYLWFMFAIHDMIGHGMTWGDVTMNSFTFSCE